MKSGHLGQDLLARQLQEVDGEPEAVPLVGRVLYHGVERELEGRHALDDLRREREGLDLGRSQKMPN